MRNAVDLPHPEGPTNTTNSPSSMSRLMSWTATTSSPETFLTSSNVTSATSEPPDPASEAFPVAFHHVHSTRTLTPAVERVAVLYVLDTLDGSVDPLAWYLSGLHGGYDRVVGSGLVLGRTGDYEQVHPGLDRPKGHIGGRAASSRAFHDEVVRNYDTVETKLFAQKLDRNRREARGPPQASGRIPQLAYHHHRPPRPL